MLSDDERDPYEKSVEADLDDLQERLRQLIELWTIHWNALPKNAWTFVLVDGQGFARDVAWDCKEPPYTFVLPVRERATAAHWRSPPEPMDISKLPKNRTFERREVDRDRRLAFFVERGF